VWGTGGYLFSLGRKLCWVNRGEANGPKGRLWTETAPAWAFEASFLLQLVNLPFSAAMLWRMLSLGVIPVTTHTIRDFAPQDLWLEQVIFASLFGFMLKDFFLHWHSPDLVLMLHHLIVCALCYTMAFVEMPGLICYAFSTVFVEIGTSACCGWVLYGGIGG